MVEAYEVLGDPIRKNEYDMSLGLSRKLPFHRSTADVSEQEYNKAGKSNTIVHIGVQGRPLMNKNFISLIALLQFMH